MPKLHSKCQQFSALLVLAATDQAASNSTGSCTRNELTIIREFIPSQNWAGVGRPAISKTELYLQRVFDKDLARECASMLRFSRKYIICCDIICCDSFSCPSWSSQTRTNACMLRNEHHSATCDRMIRYGMVRHALVYPTVRSPVLSRHG